MPKVDFNLPQTKGQFQLKGIVSGTEKDNFYTERQTKTGKPWRSVNFGVQVDKGETLYISLNGFEKEKVFFYKRPEKGEKKGVTKEVPWSDRFNFNSPGFRMIGLNIGVQKVIDSKGHEVNDKKMLTEFDAAMEIGRYLKDGDDVFVRGNIEYSSFTDNGGNVRRSVKFVPNQVSLCGKVDFEDDNFEPMHEFTQTIVFMGVEQEKDGNGSPTGRYEVEAKVINYGDIQDTSFIVENDKLAKILKKNMKPYQSIKVWGEMRSVTQTEVVEEEDEYWGESNKMEKVVAPTRRELVITGADPSTIDKDTYSKSVVETAIAALKAAENASNDFGDSDDAPWGDDSGFAIDDDDDDDMWA